MPKELRISGRLALPDALFEQAEVMAAVRPALDALRTALAAVHADATVEATLVTPRAATDDAPKPRRKAAA